MLSSVYFMFLFAVLVLSLSTIAFRHCAGTLSIKYLNVISVSFYLFLIYQVIGAVLIGIRIINDNWWVSRAHNQNSILIDFYGTLLSLLMVAIFLMIFQRLLKCKPSGEFKNLYQMPMSTVTSRNDKAVIIIVIIVSVINFIMLGYLLYKTPQIPLLYVFNSDSAYLAYLRRQATANSGILLIILNIFGRWISPLTTLILFNYLLLNKSKVNKILFGFSLTTTIMFLIYNLNKGPVLWIIIMLFVCYSIYNKRIKYAKMIGIFIMILILIFTMYTTIMQKSGFNEVKDAIIQRIFIAQHVGTILTFDLFPTYHDYLGGYNYLPFGSHYIDLTLDDKSYGVLLEREYNTYAYNQGVVGYLCSSYIADAYANFGFIGVAIANIVVALWLAIVFVISNRIRYHPISLALIVFLMFHIPRMMNDSFKAFVYNPLMFIALFYLGIVIFLARGKLVIKYRRK